jgi:hypothetical protein
VFEAMDARGAELAGHRWARFLRKPGREKAAAVAATLRHVLGGGRSHERDEMLQRDILAEIARLKAEIQATMPDNPVLSGYKVFSQVDEDGIIRALLGRLPGCTLSRTAIEVGCGNGLENNTHLLLLEGFRVCWLDGAPENIAFIRRELGLSDERKGRLMVTESFVTLDNIANILGRFCEFLGTSEPDFFSLDIDGNDLHVLTRALGMLRPKIVCVEYNSKFPPPLKLTIRYDAQHQWTGDDYHGASLQAFSELLAGYFLACCNISGANAFFVRNEFRALYPDYPVADLFQPLRTHLRFLTSGHPPSLKWARNALDSLDDAVVDSLFSLRPNSKIPWRPCENS